VKGCSDGDILNIMNTFDTNIEVINDVYQGLAKPLSEIKQLLTGT